MATWQFRGNKSSSVTTITSSTAETVIVPPFDASSPNLYGLIIANTSASTCNVTIRSGLAGAIKAIIAVPAGDTRGFLGPLDCALESEGVNKAWTAQCSSSVASIIITPMIVRN